MPIEFRCPQCGKLLRTPDASAGKKGKCPHCQSVNEIPLASTATSDSSSEQPVNPPATTRPAPRPERPAASESPAPLASDPLSNDPFATLPSAGAAPSPGQTDLFGGLGTAPTDLFGAGSQAPASDPLGGVPSSPMPNPYSPAGAPGGGYSAPNPYAAPSYAASQPSYGHQQYGGQPHRGALVLTLGIIGLVCSLGGFFGSCCCSIVPLIGALFSIAGLLGELVALAVGIPAGIFGYIDLGKMNNGSMDPSGKGMTTTGFIMGIVSAVLALMYFVLFLIGLVVFGAIIFSGPALQQR